MSLSARPPPITTYGKTTNIYWLVTFYTDSWRRPWGRHCTFNTFWSLDGPLFRHPYYGGLQRYDLLWLTRVSRSPIVWDTGSTRLRAILGLPLQKPGLRRRPARHTTPPRGGTRSSTRQRGALHRLRDTRLRGRGICASFRANSLLKPRYK